MRDCILVATYGRPESRGALRTARALAERDGTPVEVVAVYEPFYPYPLGPGWTYAGVPTIAPESEEVVLRKRVTEELQEIGGGASEWPLHVVEGRIAQAIVRAARERNAGMIVLGLRQSGGLDQWLSRETLLRVIHLAHLPVLAIPSNAVAAPSSAVVAIDYSEFSQRAAAAAARVVGRGGVLHLVHGTWTAPAAASAAAQEWARSYGEAVEARLAEIGEELARDHGIEPHVHVFAEENTARQILALAEEVDAGLIAAGSHGSGFLGRAVLGRVSGTLAHRSARALLICPPEAAAPLEEGEAGSARGTTWNPVPEL